MMIQNKFVKDHDNRILQVKMAMVNEAVDKCEYNLYNYISTITVSSDVSVSSLFLDGKKEVSSLVSTGGFSVSSSTCFGFRSWEKDLRLTIKSWFESNASITIA